MLNWWNSLESVSRVSTILNWLIAVFGLMVLLVGRRKDDLEEKATRKENQARDQLISTNQLKTEEAVRETARANLLAEQLRKENLELQVSLLPRSFQNQIEAAEALRPSAGIEYAIDLMTVSLKQQHKLNSYYRWQNGNVRLLNVSLITAKCFPQEFRCLLTD